MPKGIDWLSADLTLPSKVLAEKYGCSVQNVNSIKAKYGHSKEVGRPAGTKTSDSKIVMLRLPSELYERLEAEAKKLEKPLSTYARDILNKFA
jgi:predicted HicB family RNase H-like nuclease